MSDRCVVQIGFVAKRSIIDTKSQAMPRHPQREVHLLFECDNQPVSEYLKKELWRLKLLANEDIGECPVCTEPLTCQKCTLLLSCGHLICVTCWMKLAEPKCPVCRR